MDIFDRAQRFIGIKEIGGSNNHPLIQWWLSLCFDGKLDLPDETAWCSAFVNGMAWDLRLPRSKSARARSWLQVGVPILSSLAQVGDVVILNRNTGPADPNIIQAPGHVALFASLDPQDKISLLGGNQGNGVCISQFKVSDILGIRRLG